MLGVIGDKFSIGKETYQPFSAELHYFRIEKRYWSICFERIKKAGFRIIATAVPWNIHQDENKHYDFNGLTDPRKDLVVFLELAREFGFRVILRPGPWVGGQLPNGGLPKYLQTDLKVFARSADGSEVELPKDHGVDTGYLPSYLHSNYNYHLRNYFKAFIEITKNYIHPRGPVFMVELDYETSFGRLVDPQHADYNPDVLARYYTEFLEEKYGEIKKLNSAYKEKNPSFEEVDPPRKFDALALKDYPKALDWQSFREFTLTTYLDNLEDIFQSYTVEPLIFRSLYFRHGDLLPAFNLVPEDRAPFLGTNVFPDGDYLDLAIKARFMKSEYGFGFASSFASGSAATDAEREKQAAPIGNNTRRFYFAAGLAAGFKGMNHYMFVDRDHWYGAPLHADGTVSEGYEVAKHFNLSISEAGIEEMSTKEDIAVVGNRLYYWMRNMDSQQEFPYLKRLLDDSTIGFCRDLMRMKFNWGVRENKNWESMAKYKMLFIPTAEVMSERDQEAIVELIKGGVNVILCGLMPKYNENFKDCQILGNHFRIKTTADYHIGTVTDKQLNFPTHLYGHIRSADDSKVKQIVKVGTKVVGAASSRYKGKLYVFTFDLASGGNHHKLMFIESILAAEGITSHLFCSDPSVDVAFHMGDKKGLLYIVAPPAGALSDGFESGTRDIIIKADLRELGLKAPKLKLINLFDARDVEEEVKPIKTTSKELREGIQFSVSFPDGMIFEVSKR